MNILEKLTNKVFKFGVNSPDFSQPNDANFNSDCSNGICKRQDFCNDFNVYKLKYLYYHLPLVKSLANWKADLIVGNGVETEDKGIERDVNSFLKQNNDQGGTNGGAILSSIIQTEIFGGAGIRIIDYNGKTNLKSIGAFNYTPILFKTDVVGFDRLAFYIIHEKSQEELEKILDKVIRKDEATFTFQSNSSNYIVNQNDFIHLKLNDFSHYGESPFITDRLRLQLVMDGYLANIEDINTDGNQKQRVYLKENIQAEALGMDKFEDNVTNRTEQFNKLVEKIKGSRKSALKSKNGVDVINMAHVEKIEDVQKNIRSIEYLDFIRNEAVMLVANAYGISPELFLRNSGAISIEPILKHTVEVDLKSDKDRYSSIFEKLKKPLGINSNVDIKWKGFDLSNEADKANVMASYATVAERLFNVGADEKKVNEFIDSKVLS